MPIGPAIGHLLIGAAGGEHLARDTPRVLAQIRAGRRPATRQPQPAVTRIHHEQDVLGLQAFGDVLQIAHCDRIAGQMLWVRVDRNDVAKIATGSQPSCGAMPGKEHEHAVVGLCTAFAEAVVECGQDVVARGLPVLEHNHLRGWKSQRPGQGTGNRLRIVGGIFEPGPLRVVVDTDHDRPRFRIAGGHRGIG